MEPTDTFLKKIIKVDKFLATMILKKKKKEITNTKRKKGRSLQIPHILK